MPYLPHAPLLWLLRHARPLIPSGLCYGRLDVAAHMQDTTHAARAWVQAVRSATGCSDAPAPFVRYSPLQRCVQLAQAVRNDWQDACPAQPLPILGDPRLQELDFGLWEGKPWAQIDRTDIEGWSHNLSHHRPGNSGEPLLAMLHRVRAALHEDWMRHGGAGMLSTSTPALPTTARHVLWVTHAGVIRCVLWLLRHGALDVGLDATAQPTAAQWNLPAPDYGRWLALPWYAMQHLCTPQY